MATFVLIIVLFLIFVFKLMFVVVEERHEIIKEHFGQYKETLKPGLRTLVPIIQRAAYRQEMREQVIDVPSQPCITSDNIQVSVDGALYLKVMDSFKASYGIEDYRQGCINLAQTTMRSEIGKLTLDHTFSERDSINENIVRELESASNPWGVKVLRYEIKDITPSMNVVETMERQMEAERDKRAAIIKSTGDREYKINLSEGEKQQAINLSEGEKQRRINHAEGRAAEISLVAEATAEGLEAVAKAIAGPGGQTAVKMQLVEEFVDELGKILTSADVSVVPADLANMKGFFQGLTEVGSSVK